MEFKAIAHIKNLILKRRIKDLLFISFGVTMASIGLKGFLLPNKFLDGGAMGVSLLLDIVTHIELSYLIIIVNLPFIVIGARQISYEFALKSTLAILALAVLVHFIHLPLFTSDKLLISIFGGFFIGTGIGLSIRGGAVIDGTEVLAIMVSRKSSLTVGDFIALFNITLFCVAIFLTSLETAMYSMLTFLSASKTVDFIINGIEEYIGVLIVSSHSAEIKERIINDLGRGVTTFKSEQGYGSRGSSKQNNEILYCVITRLEVTKLILEIEKVDPNAFVVQQVIKDIKGGIVRKRPLH
jgi:uncharacterized membrane-anchored protein YitT (DUF2179 family)